MASEGSPEGPSKGGTSPSPTDLKAIVKDSLRELLRDEPALFARRSERGPTGTSGGDAPGGKYHDCSQERSVSQSRPPRRPWTATWRGCAVEAQRRGLSARGRPRGGDVVAGGLDGEPSTLAPADGRAAGVLFGIYRFLAGVTG